jgi:hypothetical protein
VKCLVLVAVNGGDEAQFQGLSGLVTQRQGDLSWAEFPCQQQAELQPHLPFHFLFPLCSIYSVLTLTLILPSTLEITSALCIQ